MRKINEIIIHCTATRPEWWAGKATLEKVAEIRRWHVQERKWKDIGYHYLIDRDGTIAPGRPESVAGAHVAGRNANTLGIALFGGHGSNENGQFSDHFTPAQDRALRGLLTQLRGQHGAVPVTGHNQYAAKACPGFRAPAWFAQSPLPLARKPKPAPAPAPAPKPQGFWDVLWRLIVAIFGRAK